VELPNPVLERAATDPSAGASLLRQLWQRAIAAPAYVATAADRRTFSLAGLELPVRATAVIVVVTFAVLLDHTRTLIPADLPGRAPETMRFVALERFFLHGIVPLALVLLAFRDRPSRYGLTLGEWRWGIGLILLGCAVMTPLVLAFAQLPDARAYYAESAAPVADLLVTNTLDLTAAEFTYRGVLMLTLVRAIGPLGVLVATLPFVFAHIGKPPLELFSTLGGGMVYGWLAWRTGSIVWGAIAHVYILTLVTVAAA
jgi:membrane protease YdiL (CAAX protease family)